MTLTITGVTLYTLVPILICCLICLYILYRGPKTPDRVVAFYIFGILVVSLCAVAQAIFKRKFLIDIALSWSILSFVSAAALSKYLEGRNLDE